MVRFAVFVSSTSVDLEEFRQVVIDQLLRMDQIPIGMEHFGSRTQDATTVSLAEVVRCDLFIGIYAFRYGYTPEENGLSITAQEYHEARSRGKRCLCYFADESLRESLLPASATEPDWKLERLAELKASIDRELVRSTFTSPEDLGRKVAADIDRLVRGEPLGYAFRDVRERWLSWYQELRATLAVPTDHLDTVPSPLQGTWNGFCQAVAWHVAVEHAQKEIQAVAADEPTLADLARHARRIAVDANYPVVLESLRPLVSRPMLDDVQRVLTQLDRNKHNPTERERLAKVRRLRQTLLELREQVETPTFHRCFLVMGGMGAGKSHFLASLLADQQQWIKADPWDRYATRDIEQVVLLLPLAPPHGQETLATLIDQALDEATGLHWRGLAEFDRFLEQTTKSFDKQAVKLVIAIHDYDRWLYVRPQFQKELIQYVESHTRLHHVDWLILLQATAYDKVASTDTNQFWQRYAYVSETAWIDAWREDTEGRFSRLTPQLEQAWPHSGGWIILDQLNQLKRIGLKILRTVLVSEDKDASLALEALDEREVSSPLLANPFIAWTLWELRETLPLKTLVNLNFIEFITRFWEKRRRELQANLAELVNTPYVHPDVLLDQAVTWIARSLAESGDFAPQLTQMVNTIVQAATGLSADLNQSEVARQTLYVLEEGSLLKHLVVPHPAAGLDQVEHIRIDFEPFWELRLAQHLQTLAPVQQKRAADTAVELETWFGAVEAEPIREGVFEFFLLLMEQAALHQPKSLSYVEWLWTLGLNQPELQLPMPSVWFAGAKAASPETQRRLVDWATAHAGELTQKRLLFAFVYFIGEVAALLDAPHCLALLQPYYAAIQKAGLSAYFFYIFEQIVARQDDNKVILASLPYLAGCEVLELTPQLAELTMSVLADNAGDDIASLFDVVVAYLQECSQRAKAEYKEHDQTQGWERYFYREWLLFEFCHLLVRHRQLATFDFLYERDWYWPHQLRLDYPITLEMEREANIAIGEWYHAHGHQDYAVRSFLDLVTDLLYSQEPHDRELAFHLIRHTVPTYGREEVKVDNHFRPFLEKVFRDTRLQRTARRFQKVFQANLPNFDELAQRGPQDAR